jgi:hypothetical protein
VGQAEVAVPLGLAAYRDRRATRTARAIPLVAVLVAAGFASTAQAQWTREEELPPADIYALSIHGDTLLAGVDQAVWVSVNAGQSWTRSADLPAPPISVDAVRLERGRLWAGTFGQGVFVSANLGQSWQPFSQGLAGGLFNSHLYMTDFDARGDSLYAGTDGAGVFALPLHTLVAWAPLGTNLVANQAGGVADLARVGNRLLACAGANGFVFHHDRGDADWTLSPLNNTGLSPGLTASNAAWTGASWLVAAQPGSYRSATGDVPWTAVGPALGSRLDGRLATAAGRTFGAWNSLAATTYSFTHDDGAHWQVLETFNVYTYELGLSGTRLWAARSDGLWWRDAATVDVPAPIPGPRLERAGAHPVTGVARFRLVLPAEGPVALVVIDVRGRAVARLVEGVRPAGPHDVEWRVGAATPGVYFARLVAAGEARTLRVVVAGP